MFSRVFVAISLFVSLVFFVDLREIKNYTVEVIDVIQSDQPDNHAKPLTCPVCEQRFHESDDGVAMPFCSVRCKMIDAARWLDERYGMPVEKPLEDDLSA